MSATTFTRALTACAKLPRGHTMRAAARRLIDILWIASEESTAEMAARLHVDPRTAQRLLIAYGVRPRDTSKINGPRRGSKRPRRHT